MPKFRKTEGGKTYNSFTGKLRVLSKEDEFLYRVEVWLLNSEVNRNNWQYLNLDEHRALFVDTPILVAYTGGKVGDGHNFRMKRDEKGEEYASFTDANAERIVGWFKNDADIRIETKDNVRWIVGNGTIWSYYARELTDMLEEQGAEGMEVSIETLVSDIRNEGNVEVFEKYQILGTTILGKGVSPAVAGAHIRTLSLEDGLKDFKLKVASYMETAKSTQKGKKRMALNRVQIDAINAKFNGYKVAATSEDGKGVCLLSEADNCLYGYTLVDGEETIVTERIKPIALNATATLDSGEEIQIDAVSLYIDAMKDSEARAEEAEARAKEAEEKANDAEKEAKELREKENKRRNKAVVDAINALIKGYNAEADAPIDEKECADIVDAAEKGEYSDCDNADGEFCGDKVACDAVKARIYDHEAKLRAKKNANVHSWLDNPTRNNSADDGSVEALISRVTK